jgi:hypothetical protein
LPALADNLTTVTLVDDTLLLESYPGLTQYLPSGQTDWTGQRGLGAKHALKAFREFTGKDPLWCQAELNDDWELVLAEFTLVIIFRGFVPASERWIEEAQRRQESANSLLANFRFKVDEDKDGTISEAEGENVRTVSEIDLRGGARTLASTERVPL